MRDIPWPLLVCLILLTISVVLFCVSSVLGTLIETGVLQ